MPRWPLEYLRSGGYYKCEKSALWASRHLQAPNTPWFRANAAMVSPRTSWRQDAPAARPSRSDLADPTTPFNFLARSGNYSRIKLALPASLPLSSMSVLYLKAALMSMIESCLLIFEKMTSHDYDHLLDDPILLRVFQDVFDGQLNVLSVLSSLRPWCRKVPDPYPSSSCAPIRVLIAGTLRDWVLHQPEDMTQLSHSQLHAPVDEADWHVHLFGVFPLEKRKQQEELTSPADRQPLPSASSSGPTEASTTASSRPPVAPEPTTIVGASSSAPGSQMPREQAVPSEEEFKSRRLEGEETAKTLRPLFDFKKVFKRLQGDIIYDDPMMADRLLLGRTPWPSRT